MKKQIKYIPNIRAFTLIELLIVISIIAVLAALLFPAIQGALTQAENARAKGEVRAIEAALLAYFNEYGMYPDVNAERETGRGNQMLSDITSVLLGIVDNDYNPRRKSFLEVNDDAFADPDAGNYTFNDPWGNPYKYMCDYNRDNSTAANGDLVRKSVMVWSRGKDGNDGQDDEKADNPKSW